MVTLEKCGIGYEVKGPILDRLREGGTLKLYVSDDRRTLWLERETGSVFVGVLTPSETRRLGQELLALADDMRES